MHTEGWERTEQEGCEGKKSRRGVKGRGSGRWERKRV